MIDAQERVSGRINYVLNVELPGMLSGKILRSPFPHARLVRVDSSRAERLAGVGAVLTGSDFSGPSGFNGKVWKDLSRPDRGGFGQGALCRRSRSRGSGGERRYHHGGLVAY